MSSVAAGPGAEDGVPRDRREGASDGDHRVGRRRGVPRDQAGSLNGTPLASREVGAGEPVVFVHGGVSDPRTWERQLSPVGERYRAIAYSRRYARPNDDIPRAPSI